MSKVHCNVIQDLIPLYAEDLCSKETGKLVEEHVQQCKGCRYALEMAQKPLTSIKWKDDVKESDTSDVQVYENILGGVQKKLRRKGRICISIVLLIAIILFIWYAPIVNVSYEQAQFEITERADGNGIYIDSSILPITTDYEDRKIIVSGRTSLNTLKNVKETGVKYRIYQAVGDDIDEVVFVDKKNNEYILWENR